VVQVGHGRKEFAEAAAKQAETLSFFPLWSYATPPGGSNWPSASPTTRREI
jgi:adenosylmethionine-8-amino-7-oxononanoate aminotransferase